MSDRTPSVDLVRSLAVQRVVLAKFCRPSSTGQRDGQSSDAKIVAPAPNRSPPRANSLDKQRLRFPSTLDPRSLERNAARARVLEEPRRDNRCTALLEPSLDRS